MTYRELKSALNELSDEQLNCEVYSVSSDGVLWGVLETRILEELPACIQDEVAEVLEPSLECYPLLCDHSFEDLE